MRDIGWGAVASLCLVAGYAVGAPVAMPITATSKELVSIGIAFGTLSALVYRNHAELTKRLDRLEHLVDSVLRHVVREASQ